MSIPDEGIVHVEMQFIQGCLVTETLKLLTLEVSGGHLRFTFDRAFTSEMESSPSHLTPVGALLLFQKLYYYLLVSETAHDPRIHGERFKIWPTAVEITMPTLIEKAESLRGELVESRRVRAPRTSGRLYQGIRPFKANGRLSIEDTFCATATCMFYDLQPHVPAAHV